MVRARSVEPGAPSAVYATLSGFTVVRLDGADARTFLHGQVSADVLALDDLGATLASYCSAKGRMLASFLVIRDGAALRLIVRSNLATAFAKRLSMFVLRAKVKIAIETDKTVLIGLIGARRAAALARIGVESAASPLQASRDDSGDVWVTLPGERTLGLLDAAHAAERVAALSSHAAATSEPCWDWVDIEQGIAYIDAATQDALTPHMANLELVGGVNFQKGCYPGQEIVARTQHLGKVKRRAYRAHVGGVIPPRPGDPVFAKAHGEQSVGMVLSAAPAADDGFDLLVSLISTAVHSDQVSIGSASGRPMTFVPLPYALPD